MHKAAARLHSSARGALKFQAKFLPSINNVRQDGLGLDVAEAWKVDVDVHMVRKASYKGSGAKVDASRIKIPFDGLTLPGALFTVSRKHSFGLSCRRTSGSQSGVSGMIDSEVAYVLQSRGCKPTIQQSALSCLAALISSCITEPLSIALLQNNENCRLSP